MDRIRKLESGEYCAQCGKEMSVEEQAAVKKCTAKWTGTYKQETPPFFLYTCPDCHEGGRVLLNDEYRPVYPYSGRFWGWDTGAVYVYAHESTWCLQSHPELMDKVLAMCDEFFAGKEPE